MTDTKPINPARLLLERYQEAQENQALVTQEEPLPDLPTWTCYHCNELRSGDLTPIVIQEGQPLDPACWAAINLEARTRVPNDPH